MLFTIDKDLTIKGTRGEIGSVHITFDTDLTGTQGVFLVKKNPMAKDEDALLVKRFTFGSNPAISGREVVISFSREDTADMPLLFPDAPFTFESDYKHMECANYVWSIQLCSGDYTETVIPCPGANYPVFRLYNEAYRDRRGMPIVPGCGHHGPDMYATKVDLMHYAAYVKNTTDQLLSGVQSNAAAISELGTWSQTGMVSLSSTVSDRLNAFDVRIISGQADIERMLRSELDALGAMIREEIKPDVIDNKEAIRSLYRELGEADDRVEQLGERVDNIESDHIDIAAIKTVVSGNQSELGRHATAIATLGTLAEGLDTRVDTLETAMVTVKDMAVETKRLVIDTVSSINAHYSAFVDQYEVDGQVVTGVDAERVFVENLWDGEPSAQDLPAVGAGGVPPKADKDVVSVETAIHNLYDFDSVLSANAAAADALLAQRIAHATSGSTEDLAQLSADVVVALGVLDMDIVGRIEDVSEATTTRIETLSGEFLDLINDGRAELEGAVSGVAGSVAGLSEVVDAMGTNLGGKIETLSASKNELSGNAKTADDALAGRITNLSSEVAAELSALDASVTGRIATATEEIGTAIDTLSDTVGSLGGDLTSLSSNAFNVDTALRQEFIEISGSASNTDIQIKGFATQLSADAKSADEALATAIGTLRNDVVSADSAIRTLADEKIAKSSIVTALNDALDNTSVPGGKATYDFVNSSINALAAFYITKNAVGDAFATKVELQAAIDSDTFYNGGAVRVPTKNDYCIVLADESKASMGFNPTTRYSFDGTQWAFQYVVNTTPLTQAQVNALNSGINATALADIRSAISGVSSDVGTLSGGVIAADTATNGRIDTLSGVVEAVTGDISTLSNDVEAVSGAVGAISGVVSGNVTTLSGHESRIQVLEESQFFNSLEDSRTWCKTFIPKLVFTDGGAVDPTSTYTDKDVLKLVLGIVKKLVSVPGKYFESQADANGWIADYVPNIVMNADGTMTDASVYNDEEVLSLVLGIVEKLANRS